MRERQVRFGDAYRQVAEAVCFVVVDLLVGGGRELGAVSAVRKPGGSCRWLVPLKKITTLQLWAGCGRREAAGVTTPAVMSDRMDRGIHGPLAGAAPLALSDQREIGTLA